MGTVFDSGQNTVDAQAAAPACAELIICFYYTIMLSCFQSLKEKTLYSKRQTAQHCLPARHTEKICPSTPEKPQTSDDGSRLCDTDF